MVTSFDGSMVDENEHDGTVNDDSTVDGKECIVVKLLSIEG